MGLNSFPKPKNEAQPRNKFLELYKYMGRSTESARKVANNERGIKKAEAYDQALHYVYGDLADEFDKRNSFRVKDADYTKLFTDEVNLMYPDEIERHIDLLKGGWENQIEEMEREGKKDDVAKIQIFIDGLEEVRNKLY